MPTEITKKDSGGASILLVRGEMNVDDAEILRRLVREMLPTDGGGIIVDLAELTFIDSESAPILREIGEIPGVSIEGIDSLLQTAINLAEKRPR